jgi:hypothetical protein
MICPGCKKDSKKSDFCSNCMRPFTPSDIAAAQNAPPAAVAFVPPGNLYTSPPAAPMPVAPGAFNPPGGLMPPSGHLSSPLGASQPPGAPLPNYLQPTLSVPAQPSPMAPARVSLTGEVIEENITQPISPYMPPSLNVTQPVSPPMPGMHPTTPPPPPPVHRSIHGSRVAMASQLGPAAVSAEMIQSALAKEDTPLGERWEKSLAIIAPIMALSMLLVHFVPSTYIYAALFDFFVVGLALGATRAIDSFDDAFMDCTAVLMVSYICGPVAGIGAYVLVSLIKQEWNAAVICVLLGHIAVRAIFVISFPDNVPWFSILPYFTLISVMGIISFTGTALSFGGWMMSNFFRPMNE